MWETADQADEARFLLATLESFQTGRVTPLLKEEIRFKIQSRRLSEGKDELNVDLSETDSCSKDCVLRPEEVERNDRRREQNRRAAAKFRSKQRRDVNTLKKVVIELERRNVELKKEVADLETERDSLREHVLGILIEKSNDTECSTVE